MALFDFLGNHWAILVVPLLGLAAIYLLLPRPRRRPVLWGAAAAGLALVLSAIFIVRVGGLATVEQYIEGFLFYAFAGTAVLFGGLLVTQENPARAALSFAVVILATTGLFLLQAGPFLMAATIIVYAGAIIVTFLFVIMLSQQQGLSDADARSREPFLASMTGFLLLIALLYILKLTYKPDLDRWVERAEERLTLIQQTAAENGENWQKAEKEIEELDRRLADLKNKGDEGVDKVQRQLNAAVLKLADEKRPLFTDLREFRSAFDRWLKNDSKPRQDEGLSPQPRLPPPEAKPLEDAFINAESVLPPQDDRLARTSLRSLESAFQGIVVIGKELRNNPKLGNLTPRTAKLSELSGPRSSRPVSGSKVEVRRDEQDQTYRPLLPAENTTYLGRSLFTDYLLAVELAGTLLLVATIGAIAIAQRREDDRRSAAPANGTISRRTA